MAEPTTPSIKAPWHLWVVGAVSVLWNSVGVMDFTMTQMKNAAYLSAMTPKQIDFINAIPVWVVVAWGIAVWTGFLGSLLLLFRRRWAVCVFCTSIVCVALTDVYTYLLSNGLEVMGGPKGLVFPAVIFVIAVLLWMYARAMSKRGVLR